MKHLLSGICMAIASCLVAPNLDAQDLSDYKTIDYKIRDLALIYQGGMHRLQWKTDHFEPYVTHVFEDGTEKWTFDGFLFLEFRTGTSPDYQFTQGYTDANARRQEWEWYLDRIFQKDRALDALDQVIAQKKKTLGDPGFKHKVVLTTPVPIINQKDWGELDGKQLDFTTSADRLAAGTWFVDQLVSRFNEAGYENIELAGFYMICESSKGIETYTRSLSKVIKGYGLDFVWIPYFNAQGYSVWKGLKFDIAYLQPNHFFNKDVPDSRLDEAVQRAKENGMAMEFECDESIRNDAAKLQRMVTYMDYYDKHGIWYDTPLAYYTGGSLIYDLHRFRNSTSAIIKSTMDRFFQYIVNRRLKALENSGVGEIAMPDENPVYYNLNGIRVENPANGIFIEKCGGKVSKVVK